MKQLFLYMIATAATAVAVAGLYVVMMVVIEELQHFFWFELGRVEEWPWMALPIAIVGGIVLSWCLHFFSNSQEPEIGHTLPELLASTTFSYRFVGQGIILGVVSLVAGASLGPEGVLLPICYGLGYLIAVFWGVEKPALIGMMGIVALLAAFFNAPGAALLPLGFVLLKKGMAYQQMLLTVLFGTLAVVVSIGVLRFLKQMDGYVNVSSIEMESLTMSVVVITCVVAALATLVPVLINRLTPLCTNAFARLPQHWLVRGAVAGLGIGIIYSVAGPVVYFSGHHGVEELIAHPDVLSTWQFLVLSVLKIVVTVWSLATIYRGGMIFPQLLAATSLALVFHNVAMDSTVFLSLLVAAFFGVFVGALGSLCIAAAFVLSVFGMAVWPLVILASIGSLLVRYLLPQLFAVRETVQP